MLFFNYLNIIEMKYIILLLIGLSLTFVSCEEFLKEEPTGSLTYEAEITSTLGGRALATGAYRALPRWTRGTSEWGGNIMASMEYWTGKAYSQYMGARLWKFESDDEDGGEDYFMYPWSDWYMGVRDCNLSLEMLSDVKDFSEEEKLRYIGEVRTLRAFYYFCLVRYYGDVIYNTTVLENVELAQQPRTSLTKIYNEIIVPDLEFAVNESTLPEARSNGRVTKDVARAILADVYLTMAGYPYQEQSVDTTKAWCTDGLWSMSEYPVNTQSAKDFLRKSKVQLENLYGKYPIGELIDLNNPDMDNKGGAIFQIQYLAGVYNLSTVFFALPMASQVSVFSVETGTVIPSIEYYNSYNPADKRIKDRVYFYYSDTKSVKYDPNESPAGKFPLPFLYKYYDVKAVKETGNSGLNFNLYRYADILLMLTEVNWSLKQLGDAIPNDDVVKGINEVRIRAGLPTYSGDQITLLDIMSERAYELVFENKMIWDQRRTRRALVDGSGKFNAIENFVGHQPSNFSYKFSAQHLLSPISATEISRNAKCLQNYGWTPTQHQ
jgi:starch-binding outer membrane protein, SusD/RagB family